MSLFILLGHIEELQFRTQLHVLQGTQLISRPTAPKLGHHLTATAQSCASQPVTGQSGDIGPN